jgi:hypothetical protein
MRKIFQGLVVLAFASTLIAGCGGSSSNNPAPAVVDGAVSFESATYSSARNTSLGDGWYGISTPMDAFGDTSSDDAFALIGYETSSFYVTDVNFTGAGTLTDDANGDGAVYLYGTTVAEDLAPTISDLWWTNGGTGVTPDYALAGYGNVIETIPGYGWGADPAGAPVFSGLTAPFTADYDTINFKVKADGYTGISIKFPVANVEVRNAFPMPSSINVADIGAASSTVSVDISNGTGTISVDVTLDADGEGSAAFNIGPTDDATDTIATSTGSALTATYADSNANDQTATATIKGLLNADDDGDGSVYIGKVSRTLAVDFDYGTDYASISEWGSGAAISDPADAEHGWDWVPDPGAMGSLLGTVYGITPGGGWGRDAGAIAFTGFAPGTFSEFTTANFKFNSGGVYDSVTFKFSNANANYDDDMENTYMLADYATALGNDWYEVSVPMSDFGTLADWVDFAILLDGTDMFKVTDIHFK